jgi:transposase-like protein
MVGREVARNVARELGLSQNAVSGWVFKWKAEHGNTPPPEPPESKTPPPPVSSARPVSATNVDQAAKNLVDVLGAYITAVIDARVNEAIAERMKRMM